MSPRAWIIATVVVLLVGLTALIFRLSPHSSSTIRVVLPPIQRTDDASKPPLATVLVKKDPHALSTAARGLVLAKVMYWRNQPRFKDGREPGDTAFPDDCLAEADADPKLAAWLATWHANLKQGKQASEQDRESLAALLKGSTLPSLVLLDIGRAIDFLSEDRLTAARFYVAAGYAGAKEASAAKDDPVRYRSILLGLDSIRFSMWPLVDEHQLDLVPALKVICDAIAEWEPRGDPILDKECIWARIDAAECLYLQQKPEEALDLLRSIDYRKLTSQQKLGAAWAEGITFFDAGHYSDAIPCLQSVVEGDSTRSQDAMYLLIVAFAKTGQRERAESVYDEYLRLAKPEPWERKELAEEVASTPISGALK